MYVFTQATCLSLSPHTSRMCSVMCTHCYVYTLLCVHTSLSLSVIVFIHSIRSCVCRMLVYVCTHSLRSFGCVGCSFVCVYTLASLVWVCRMLVCVCVHTRFARVCVCRMRFVGVISGGKDSVLAIHLCVASGHELVGLANLYPPSGISELDSYMYQCAGSELVEAIGSAFEVPLVRVEMKGTPIAIHSNDYTPTRGDEVEDLFTLLSKCIDQFPEFEAISTGAVFSNYQKNRVENCCERLGIVSMAPLWELPQVKVLDLVEEHKIEAIIVKTAFVGLDDTHIGKTTRELRPVFRKLAHTMGFNECGEGGEFESIVIDCPLFKTKKLQLVNPVPVKHGRDCWLLKTNGAVLVDKCGATYTSEASVSITHKNERTDCSKCITQAVSVSITHKNERTDCSLTVASVSLTQAVSVSLTNTSEATV